MVLKAHAALNIEGFVRFQFTEAEGYVPLPEPLPYTLIAQDGGPDLNFTHDWAGTARTGNAQVLVEVAHGRVRAIIHGRETEELCEINFEDDEVNVHRAGVIRDTFLHQRPEQDRPDAGPDA